MKAKRVGNIIFIFSWVWMIGFSVFYQPIAQLIFHPDELTYFYSGILYWIVPIACVGVGFIARQMLCKEDSYTISKANAVGIIIMCIAIFLMPFTNFLSRTQVTENSITEYSVSGTVTETHEIKDAKSVYVDLHPIRMGYELSYRLTFDDGYELYLSTLGAEDSSLWWNIVYKIDSNITNLEVEKSVDGWDLYEEAFNSLYFKRFKKQALQILNLK